MPTCETCKWQARPPETDDPIWPCINKQSPYYLRYTCATDGCIHRQPKEAEDE